jgi:hypothetical protein
MVLFTRAAPSVKPSVKRSQSIGAVESSAAVVELNKELYCAAYNICHKGVTNTGVASFNPHQIRREVQPTNGLRAAITRVQRHIHRRAAVSNRWRRQVGGAKCLEATGGGVGEGALAEVDTSYAVITGHQGEKCSGDSVS